MTKATQPKTRKTPALKLLIGATAIKAAIASIDKRGKSLEKDIHLCAVSCLAHADQHGDITLANNLIEAISNMARKNALREWFIAHGKFRYDEETKVLGYDKSKRTMQEEAAEHPFWSFKPEAEYKPMDLTADLLRVLHKARQRMATNKGDKVDPALVRQLESILPAKEVKAMQAEMVKAVKPAAVKPTARNKNAVQTKKATDPLAA